EARPGADGREGPGEADLTADTDLRVELSGFDAYRCRRGREITLRGANVAAAADQSGAVPDRQRVPQWWRLGAIRELARIVRDRSPHQRRKRIERGLPLGDDR